MAKNSEYEAFTLLVDRILAVPLKVIKQRIREERKRIAAHRPGPKKSRKHQIPPDRIQEETVRRPLLIRKEGHP